MTEREEPGDDRYPMVFVLLLASYLLSALVDQLEGRLGSLGLYLAALLVALRSVRLRRTAARRARGGLAAATLLVAMLAGAAPPGPARGVVAGWAGAVTLLTVWIVLRRIVRHEVITLQTVFGALSAYLLIGFTFAAMFTTLSAWGGEPFFADGRPADNASLQYFSFVTLTTTGYGDLTAAGAPGRALAVLEALLGQIFLVTLVARLVALFGTTRKSPPPGPGTP